MKRQRKRRMRFPQKNKQTKATLTHGKAALQRFTPALHCIAKEDGRVAFCTYNRLFKTSSFEGVFCRVYFELRVTL